jgi:hypothetical protein
MSAFSLGEAVGGDAPVEQGAAKTGVGLVEEEVEVALGEWRGAAYAMAMQILEDSEDLHAPGGGAEFRELCSREELRKRLKPGAMAQFREYGTQGKEVCAEGLDSYMQGLTLTLTLIGRFG